MGIKSLNDKFYTNPLILNDILKYIDLGKYDFVIEPSAGNGSFSNIINKKRNNFIAMDIEPENLESEIFKIEKINWFDYKIEDKYKKVLIIGNPPFGVNNNLSLDFIRHSISFKNTQTIAFILPNVFNKYSKQKIFPKEWKLARVIELPRNSFLLNDEEYHVPCSFYIWTKENIINDLRFDIEKYSQSEDFDFISNNKDFKNADFFIMGSNPANIIKIHKVKSNNRGYYIKVKKNISEVSSNFKNIKWNENGNSSASGGVSWFSKSEIIYLYDKLKKN